MSADIKLDGDNLILEGNVIINDYEVQSTGPNSGYAFRDRIEPDKHRFVWYATEGKVHLWSDAEGSNILSINKFGIIPRWSPFGPKIKPPGGGGGSPTPDENYSLHGALMELFRQIKVLRAELKELKEKG